MRKTDIPQDSTALTKMTRELCYAVDDTGNYTTGLSSGWSVKTEALDLAWNDIEKRIQNAKEKVLKGDASPILYFMELRLMDLEILSSYTGFWKFTIKRHLKYDKFKKLSIKKLNKYADAFNIKVEELLNMNSNG